MKDNLIEYYNQRASEYELIYQKPERQKDLQKIKEQLKQVFSGRSVLEIACGTGYWTETIAEAAEKILATDVNEAVLDLAQKKQYPRNNVVFSKIDIDDLTLRPNYNALFGGFIWSHIEKGSLDDFLHKINSLVPPGSIICFLDNKYVEKSSTPIAYTDEDGNTYQIRKLQDEEFLILKNFPSMRFLYNSVEEYDRQAKVIELEYYWLVIYQNN